MRQAATVITLGVRDLARARRFYEALGWTTGAAPQDDVVFFQTGATVLALWDRALAHGAEALAGPTDMPYGERQCSFRDPGGHLWTLTETVEDVLPEDWGGISVGG